ncbi:hypothetical protein [Shimia sp. Alg240-R146]|uniref:hypothetical protein n=1 Tax=Shimia sp. Alg240-R146 TaxID=2993449 RepID=UPI0022E5BAB3|nr:hypothetical protein [Shimia sp. Alg240-R146]
MARFPIETCGVDEVVILSTLSVEARGLVSNATEDKAYNPNAFGQAFAKTHLVCNVGSDNHEADWTVSASNAAQGNIRTYRIRNATLLRGRQTVDTSVQPHCRVTDAINLWDEIAALTVSKVKLIIEVVPPKLYRRTFSDNFLDYLRENNVTIPSPVTDAEKKAEKKAKAKKKEQEKTEKPPAKTAKTENGK